MKTAIIFGATGQDGSYLSEFLISKDYFVVGVARRVSTTNTQRINHLLSNSNFLLAEGDITDPHSVNNILNTYKDSVEVYNLAAQSHVGTSFKQPATTWDITGKGCLNILERRIDNYHNISSVFYPLHDLYDILDSISCTFSRS